MVPLNVHHSLSLRSVAKNSKQLQNISNYINALAQSLTSLEHSAREISGSTNQILKLLESKEHREETISQMRMLIFRHSQTCSEAEKEADPLTAIATCIVSERMLNQDWFDIELFSRVSFEEMTKADDLLRRCSESMSSIKSKLTDEQAKIAESIPRYMDQIQELEAKLSVNRVIELLDYKNPIYNYNKSPVGTDFPGGYIENTHTSYYENWRIVTYVGWNEPSINHPDFREKLKNDGTRSALSKIKIDDQLVAKAEAKSRTNPYIWGNEYDVREFQQQYSRKVRGARTLKHNLEKLRKDVDMAEKRLSDLLEKANEEFSGRIQIELREGVQ
tara:strand:+ start:200 stop:1195 length:996 start_codon:yes stop_codon:yes gene_type:complete